MMNDRQRALAVLRYQPYDRLPVVHFGFWGETLRKWAAEGHLTEAEAAGWGDGNPVDAKVSAKLGFDFNWYSALHPNYGLSPHFESKVVRAFPDGTRHLLNTDGVVVVDIPGAGSIHAEVEHLLKDRLSWETLYKSRYQWSPARVNGAHVRVHDQMIPFDRGGVDFLRADTRDYLYGLHCGSLYGQIRNVLGLEGSSYLYADDEPLFTEIIDAVADLCYRNTAAILETGARFDFAHFWEDICFKNGPLIVPAVFEEKVGPHYKRITDLCGRYGLDIVSLDCDGMIDALIPTWLNNGVNTMFPIEVGTWNASLAPWRGKFGRALRGVGGMNKTVFTRDRAAVDREIERLRELVALGGFIPCPDHRLAPDSKWELVRYYCDNMRELFS